MNDFNFEFLLNHSMQTCSIKPPLSFHALLEIAQERFDLTKITEFYFQDEDIKISNESDYFDFLNWSENSQLKEIEIIVKSGDSKAKRKKSSSFRKISQSYKPPTSSYNNYAPDDDTVNGRFIFLNIF